MRPRGLGGGVLRERNRKGKRRKGKATGEKRGGFWTGERGGCGQVGGNRARAEEGRKIPVKKSLMEGESEK